MCFIFVNYCSQYKSKLLLQIPQKTLKMKIKHFGSVEYNIKHKKNIYIHLFNVIKEI